MVDRFGEPPKGVLNLVDVALLRAKAAGFGISKLEQKGDTIHMTMETFDFPAVSAVCAEPAYKNRIFFAANSEKPLLSLRLKKDEDPLKMAQELVKRYGAAKS